VTRKGRLSYADSWPMLTGYIAQMVMDGSDDAAQILAYAHELRPSTQLFTGTVEQLVYARKDKT
jgi:hypothetical protein